MTEQWVVTFKITHASGDIMITEFYRGAKEECLRIGAHSGAGSNDLYKTVLWRAIVGPAKEWDDFLSDESDDKRVMLELLGRI